MSPAAGRAGSRPRTTAPAPETTVVEINDRLGLDDGVTTVTRSGEPAEPAAPVTDSVYNPAKDREDMRKWLGTGILGMTGIIALIAAIAVLVGSTESETLLTGVFTPLVGLSGAVIGFYFGGKDTKG